MLVVAGLGNPGEAYRKTRHNAGFMLLDRFASGAEGVEARIDGRGGEALLKITTQRSRARNAKPGAEAEGDLNGTRFLLVKPATFMNESGKALASLRTRGLLKTLDELLVVVDDVDLMVGTLRLRAKGSAGGHNGLKSIISHLGGNEFARLRIGVGPRPGGHEMVDHVLGTFRPEEYEALEPALGNAARIVEAWVSGGMDYAQQMYSQLQPTT